MNTDLMSLSRKKLVAGLAKLKAAGVDLPMWLGMLNAGPLEMWDLAAAWPKSARRKGTDDEKVFGAFLASLVNALEPGGPPVNMAKLTALDSGTLQEHERQEVLRLVCRYRAWHDAFSQVQIQSSRSNLARLPSWENLRAARKRD